MICVSLFMCKRFAASYTNIADRAGGDFCDR